MNNYLEESLENFEHALKKKEIHDVKKSHQYFSKFITQVKEKDISDDDLGFIDMSDVFDIDQMLEENGLIHEFCMTIDEANFEEKYETVKDEIDHLCDKFRKVVKDLKGIFVFSYGAEIIDLHGGELEIKRLSNKYYDLEIDLIDVGEVYFKKGDKKKDKIKVKIYNTRNQLIARFEEYGKTKMVGIRRLGGQYYSYVWLG